MHGGGVFVWVQNFFRNRDFKSGHRLSKFVPITYRETFAVVREVAEKSGTPYNKAAYEAEAKREAQALTKKQQPQEMPAPPKQ